MKKQTKGSKTIFYNRLMRGSRVVYCYPTEPRPVATFISEIRKAIKKAPADPVRIEILETEMESASEACYSLGDGFMWSMAQHIDPRLKSYGVFRMAVFGPDYSKPEPVKTLACSNQVDANKAVERMRAKYGPEYHVESYSTIRRGMTKGRWECRVWRGEDWLRRQQGQWTAVEIAEYLRLNTGLAEHYRPQAEKHRAQQQRCREAQRKSVEEKQAQKQKVDAFILREWNRQKQQVASGEKLVKQAYASIIEKVKAQFHSPASKADPLVISDSRIARVRGTKK